MDFQDVTSPPAHPGLGLSVLMRKFAIASLKPATKLQLGVKAAIPPR